MEIINYSYKDLTPILNGVNKKSATLWEQANTLNKRRIHLKNTPPEWDKTLPELASEEKLYWRASRKFNKEIMPIEKGIEENIKAIQDYKTETDRRNNILNRMSYLKWIMKDWYNSDTKNRLAWTNMVRDALKEYKQLREEANKFIPLINKQFK